jgi:hypothetical protein
MLCVAAVRKVIVLLGLPTLLFLPAIAPAQVAKTDARAVPETEEEKRDRESRRMCAVALCSTLHNRRPANGHITCKMQKTWPKEVITKNLARGKLSWPWGDARCGSKLKFDRALLVRAMEQPEVEVQFDTYEIRCHVEGAKETYDISAQVSPKVTFKQGKATKARLNWGKIDAPTLAKTALWSVTAVDNTFGVLESLAVEEINKYIDAKCMEVKEEWQGK